VQTGVAASAPPSWTSSSALMPRGTPSPRPRRSMCARSSRPPSPAPTRSKAPGRTTPGELAIGPMPSHRPRASGLPERELVDKVSEATAGMLERIGSIESEFGSVIGPVRSGCERLAAELERLQANLGDVAGLDASRARSTGKDSTAHADGARMTALNMAVERHAKTRGGPLSERGFLATGRRPPARRRVHGRRQLSRSGRPLREFDPLSGEDQVRVAGPDASGVEVPHRLHVLRDLLVATTTQPERPAACLPRTREDLRARGAPRSVNVTTRTRCPRLPSTIAEYATPEARRTCGIETSGVALPSRLAARLCVPGRIDR